MTQRIQRISTTGRQPDSKRWPDGGSSRFKASVSSAGGGVSRLSLSGDIDLSVRDRLRDIVQARLVSEDVKALLIDLGAVTFLDCGAIGVLVVCGRLAADIGCGYRVVNATGIVASLLDLTDVLELGLDGAERGPRAGLPRHRQGGLDGARQSRRC